MSYLYRKNQIVTHLKTGGNYIILETPGNCFIEETNKPAYMYKCLDKGKVWVRSAKIMEDGRFQSFDISSSPGLVDFIVARPTYSAKDSIQAPYKKEAFEAWLLGKTVCVDISDEIDDFEYRTISPFDGTQDSVLSYLSLTKHRLVKIA